MNPRTQECRGRWGYGSGYFARESRLNARLNPGTGGAAFCNECPITKACWDEHRASMQDKYPEEAGLFDRLVAAARAAGDQNAGQTIAVGLAAAGTVDPYMRGALDNMQQGVDDRG